MTTKPKTITLSNLQPGGQYDVWVRGVTKDGKYSYWSKNHNITVIGDTVPPSQPAAPTVYVGSSENVGPQSVRVRHDGLRQTPVVINGVTTTTIENDVFAYQVWVNTSNSNSGGTQVGTIPAVKPSVGAYSEATFQVDAPNGSTIQYFYVIAIDSSGNKSPASPTATASSIPFFSNAYISDLSATKITTGTLQASQQISVGTSTPIVIKSNASAPYGQIYIGNGTYNDTNTPFYVGSDSRFSVGNALSFTANSGVLTLSGGSGSETTTVQIKTSDGQISYDTDNGALNVIGSTYRMALDANEIQVSTTSSSSLLKLNRYGGGIQIGTSGTESDTNIYGDLKVNGSGGLTYALETTGSNRISGDIIVGPTVAGNGQRLRVDGSGYIDGNLTVTGNVTAANLPNLSYGSQSVAFSANASKTTTINFGTTGSYAIITATPQSSGTTDFVATIRSKDLVAGTASIDIATRGGGTYTGTVYLNWQAAKG